MTRRGETTLDWFDFHCGVRVTKNYTQPQLFWYQMNEKPKNETRCINVLFLDMHAAAVSPYERDGLITNVQSLDNPGCAPPPGMPL